MDALPPTHIGSAAKLLDPLKTFVRQRQSIGLKPNIFTLATPTPVNHSSQFSFSQIFHFFLFIRLLFSTIECEN